MSAGGATEPELSEVRGTVKVRRVLKHIMFQARGNMRNGVSEC
jgi:hypothetical protein